MHDTAESTQAKLALKKNEFAKVVDEGTGAIRVVQGPQVLVPAKATEQLGRIQPAFELLNHQYVRLIDQATGQLRVERGEAIIVPGPNEEADGAGVRDAINVDEETAVLVVSKQSGQQRLITERGLFFPGKYDEIVEVHKLVRVEPHEVAITRDNDGAYHFYSGSRDASIDPKGTAFFLQPYHELVTMMWSSGTSAEDVAKNVVRNAKQVAFKVPVQKIDLRPQCTLIGLSLSAHRCPQAHWSALPTPAPLLQTHSSSTPCERRTMWSSYLKEQSSGKSKTLPR